METPPVLSHDEEPIHEAEPDTVAAEGQLERVPQKGNAPDLRRPPVPSDDADSQEPLAEARPCASNQACLHEQHEERRDIDDWSLHRVLARKGQAPEGAQEQGREHERGAIDKGCREPGPARRRLRSRMKAPEAQARPG